MVMRRVFNHHVCLCVLSTAILAGLALMTSQTKVYAQAQQAKNCKGMVNGGDGDESDQPIVCDGGLKGRGDHKGELSGGRTINMNGHPGVAVTITGSSTKIRINSELTVWDSRGSNDTTAIKVDKGGELKLVGDVSVTDVKKGIVVSDSGSSVTVVQGSIGVGMGMGPVIEVSKEGKVVLMEDVTVTGSGGSEGEVVINNGGTVQLNGQSFTGVITGIKIMGNGNASVKGGATIGVRAGGKGFKVEGTATANVMDMTINGSGGGGNRTGVEMGSTGTLTMTKVGITTGSAGTGAKVTKGTLELNGGSTIDVAAGATGVEVSNNGKVEMMGATITLQGDGSKGLVMKGGTATVVMGSITGSGNGMGVEMSGSANVTLTNVTMNQVGTGITKSGGGTLELNGGTKIDVAAGGKGIDVSSGKVTMEGGSITGNGGSGTGLVMSGNANVTLTSVTMTEFATGITMTGGTLKLDGGSTIEVGHNGTGLEVKGGTANVMGATITGSGNGMGTTGVEVSGNADVTLTSVTMREVKTGITMTGNGALTLNGGSITAGSTGTGTGISATDGSGNVTVKGEARIEGFTTGIYMKGSGELKVEEGTRITVGAGGKGVYVGESVTANLTGVTITGSGGSEKGVEVKGSANVTLTRVTMKQVGTGVEVAGNGTLTLDGGSITGSGSGTGINVIMGGDVTVKGVNISEFTTGIKMMGGKSLTVKDKTRIEFTGNYGVMVGDKVTSAELTKVTITGSGTGKQSKGVWVMGGTVVMNTVNVSNVGTGVLMEEKVTSAELMGVTIRGVEKGIKMEGKGTFTVSGTTIQFTGNDQDGYGVMVGDKVQNTTLTDVTITGSGGSGSKGVWVKGGGVVMNTVNVSNVGMGINMEGGNLTVSGGSIGFTGGYGVVVGDKVTSATLTDVTITGQNKGVGINMTGGSLTVSGGSITGVRTGISMEGKGELKVERVTRIQFMGTYGVMVGDKVTSATLTDVTITGSGGSGVLMMGSTVTMTRVNVSKVETGIYAMGGNLTVIGGEIKEVKTGIKMESKGTLTVKDRTTINFTGDDGYGVSVGDKVTSATLTDVTIRGNKSGGGIWVKGGSGNVKLERVTISEVKAGIAMMGSGELKVGGNSTIQFTGKDGYGVYVGSSVQNTSLIGVTITGSGTGIYAEGGSLTVKEGTITGVKMGVWVKGGSGKVTLERVTISGVKAGINMTGTGTLTVEKGTRIEFTGDYGVYVGNSVASTTLTNV
ncbi:beta strand repeat-containing protein [Bartonella schoenbuchensis]|uniref:beta strand repeat-containing protein n=1 Tax=Bartonella schoenbuchensis TaxID=165694 RepID=UPI00314544B6